MRHGVGNRHLGFRQENIIGFIRWRADFRDEIEANAITDIAEQQILLGIAKKQLDLILNSR